VERPHVARPRALVAVAILAGVVAVAGLGMASILSAALVGVVLMIFSGCVRIDEIYDDLDWRVVFLLAGLIPLGIAMDGSGGADWMGQWVARYLGPLPPVVAIGAFYLLTSLLTEVMSNNAAAVVLTPIAIATAGDLSMNPYALLVAVMFGASASFMTPVGYQTNTLVYGPGGYRFTDFLKVGGPLNLILLVTASLLIPVFWPS
jgi:di/tricarboxylate transporter